MHLQLKPEAQARAGIRFMHKVDYTQLNKIILEILLELELQAQNIRTNK